MSHDPPPSPPPTAPSPDAAPAVRVFPGRRGFDLADPLALAHLTSAQRRRRAWFRRLAPWVAVFLLTLAWDRAVYLNIAVHDPAKLQRLESSDWYRTLRIVGAPWAWLFVAAVLVLTDNRRGAIAAKAGAPDPGLIRGGHAALRRATFLLLSALLSGGAAELIKGLVGRFKPEETGGMFKFASLHLRFVEWKWNDLGFPSSHAALAFGACFAMAILFPRARLVFLAMAIGCSVSRLLAGAHFLSDTYAALVLAFLITRGVYALDRRNNQGEGVDHATA